MANTYTHLIYHIIYSTKNREQWLVKEVKDKVFAYKAGILKNHNANPIIINGALEHIHILCELNADCSVADIVRTLKSNSTLWFQKTFKRSAFRWQEGYAAFTVSPSRYDAVYKYIVNQEEHHKKITFQDEYLRFLTEHRIKYDERYIFD